MSAGARRLGWWLVTVVLFAVAVGFSVRQELPQLVGSVVGSAPNSEPASARSEPCLPGTEIPVMRSPHLSVAALRKVHYNSEPPTSGPHFAIPPILGIYDTPLPPSAFVHAEEHGHVIIAYSPALPAQQVSVLKSMAKSHPADVLMTPYQPLSHGVSLAAWGRLEHFDQVDRPGMERFIVALAGRYDHHWVRRTC